MKHRFKPNIPSDISNDFKISLAALIFFIMCFHLFEVIYFPNMPVISEKVLLTITLFAIIYLWGQEVKDKKRTQIINKKFLVNQEELKKSNIAVMKALVMSEEARDAYTSGHSGRVTEYAVAIAKKMNLGREDRKHIEYAGYLHDIGKIGISDTVLNKPGSLNDEEWQIVKKHPKTALEILDPLKFLSEEKLIIKHHHERYDGKGYPDGLKGENIPLGAMIMAVADSFDAMNSKRPYRDVLPKDAIIAELKASRGTQFDPKIVDMFLIMLAQEAWIFEGKDK